MTSMTTPTPDAICERLRASIADWFEGGREDQRGLWDRETNSLMSALRASGFLDLIQQQQATIERLSAEKVEIAEQAAQIAENWQSSLRPGNEHRLHGHHEAAHEIAHAIRNTFGKEASDVRAREEDRG